MVALGWALFGSGLFLTAVKVLIGAGILHH